MIRGITHTETGESIQRLAVTTKIAIGLPPDPKAKSGHPTKLDHFIFLKKSTVEQNKWEIDQDLTKLFGAKCRSVEIVLLDDDIENVFPTKLAWFTASQCKCFGNGSTATRRTEKHPEGEPWTPCGPTCPDLERGDCKPSGDLRFMLAAVPKLGSVVRVHTSSIRSVQQISSSLQQIQTLLGGRLAGIRCNLVVRPEKTSYLGPDQKRHSTTIYAMNLEIQSEGIHALISKMTDHARLFEQTKKILGTGHIEIVEPDEERAEEIASEFYPTSDIAPAAVKFPEPEEQGEIVEPKKQANMDVRCGHCGGVNGHETDCKFAEKKAGPAPKLISLAVQIVKLVKKESAPGRVLSVNHDQHGAITISCWHKSMYEFLDQYAKPKVTAILDVANKPDKDNPTKIWTNLERIVEIGNVQFPQPAEQGVMEAEPPLFGTEE